MSDKRQEACELLAEAVQNAIPGMTEAFKAVVFAHDNVLVMALTTLARLRFLEVTIIQTLLKEASVPMAEGAKILGDVERMVLISMLASKSISPEDAKELCRGEIADDVIEKAAGGVPKYESREAAHKVLNDALEKIRHIKGTL